MRWIYVVPCNARDRDTIFINADRIGSIRLVEFELFLEPVVNKVGLPEQTNPGDAKGFLYTLVDCLSNWQDGHVLVLKMDNLSCVFEQAGKAKIGSKG